MSGYEIKGDKKLLKQLKKNAEMKDIFNVVKMNASELQRKAQRNATFKGHTDSSGKFIKPTGATKRSIRIEIGNKGLAAKIAPTTEYAGCFQIARNVNNRVLESVKIGGNLIVKPFFRVWNMV